MTRKDYERIAEVLDRVSREGSASGFDMATKITEAMANMLADDNPRFDRKRFFTAAGMEYLG